MLISTKLFLRRFATLLLVAAGLFFSAGLSAQAPAGFRFQAVARDAANDVMTSDNIAVRVSLLRGGPSGAVGYSERHEVTTTDLGVFDLHIGNGAGLSGDMNTLDWGTDTYFLKIDIDPEGGDSYINLGASQLLSVPYALYAKESGSGGGGGDPTDELQNLIYDPDSQTLTLTDGNSVTLQVGGDGGMPQTLTFDEVTGELAISNGNTITLPAGLQGPQGEAGPQGPAGADGADGTGIALLGTVATVGDLPVAGNANGDLYIVSADGDGYAWDGSMFVNVGPIQGPAGPQGSQGDAGSQGPQGDQGPVGMNGSDGSQGPQGNAGPQGPQGDAGPQGSDGPQGPAGQDGTGISIQGTVATIGDLPAVNNEAGDLYIVSADGNGYVWDGSMFVNVGQIQGPQGPQGDAGPQGPTGMNGSDGIDGALGPQGNTGPQGDAGPQGPTGMNGIDGTDGAQGPQGDAGPQGLQGNVGPTGPAGPAGELELPYYDETVIEGAAFHIQNDFLNGRFGIAGSVGTGAENLPANNAGVMGSGTGGHGVYGYSETSFFAGVQGVSNSPTGVGVQGYGFGGGVGGHFYTTSGGVAALTTGRGNVGIGIDEPEMKMHVGGDLFVQTNLGELIMGFPNNGNQWQFSTRGSGADLQFQSKLDGSNSFTTRFRMRQGGEFQIGDVGTPSAWAHIRNNSTLNKPQLKLEEVGNDYARLELTNDAASGAYWHVAGLPSSTASAAKLNFYFRNASGAGDRMTITGDGQVGVNTSNPSARLTINQGSQSVGTGLSFRDNTANQDWHMTHGFALRFHYGNSLRGFINATTGAYVQSSDRKLKDNIQVMTPVLDKLSRLALKTYHYKSDETAETTIGLVAQEAKELFPELVSYSEEDKLYGVNYAGFSMVAIKAIQEQQQAIDAQAEEIESLEARLTRLEALMSKKD